MAKKICKDEETRENMAIAKLSRGLEHAKCNTLPLIYHWLPKLKIWLATAQKNPQNSHL